MVNNITNLKNATLLKTGIIGTILAALCCFTPVLVTLLGVIGLASIIGYLDTVLLSTLAAFALLAIYALWKKWQV